MTFVMNSNRLSLNVCESLQNGVGDVNMSTIRFSTGLFHHVEIELVKNVVVVVLVGCGQCRLGDDCFSSHAEMESLGLMDFKSHLYSADSLCY